MKTFDLQPNLVGDLLELRPLVASGWEGLFAAAADPEIWKLHPANDRYKEGVFKAFFLDGAKNLRSRQAVEKIGGVVTDRRVNRTLNGEAFEHVDYHIHKPGAPKLAGSDLN